MPRFFKHTSFLAICVGIAIPAFIQECSEAFAQDIPGSVDAGRIDASPKEILPRQQIPQINIPLSKPSDIAAPEGAESLTFVLKNVTVEGMSAFSQEEIADIYRPFIGKEIPLSRVWEMARRISEQYQQKGYFLSRAYVPAQEVDDGTIVLRVIEGYIGDVLEEGERADNYLVKSLEQRILKDKPIRLANLENSLLLLEDIPGVTFEAVLARMGEEDSEGTVRLVLKGKKTQGRGSVLFDNHGSRFSGPHRVAFAYENSFIPNQNTAISGIASIPGGNELRGAAITHEIKLLPALGLNLSAGHTVSTPGYRLKDDDIKSRAVNLGAEITWQAIRQRRHNLNLGLMLDARNVNTDILGTPLTRDRVRSVRLRGSYDGIDPLGGYNTVTATISRGITGLGANDAGDLNLSRADAKPDFTKIEATWQHTQPIFPDWLAIGTLTAQRASKALYSSEEFGIGGPSIGRAYDSSEITGDHGVGLSLEMKYTGIQAMKGFTLTPYAFYDFGKIWNIDSGQDDGLSLSSAGFGLDVYHTNGFAASLTIAQPLTKSIDTPTYGNNGHNPRIYFQTRWSF